MESLGRCAAIILAVILLFFIPLRYDAVISSRSIESYIENETEHFMNNLLVEQKLTLSSLEEFQERLGIFDSCYTVSLSGYETVYYMDEASNQVTESEYDNLIYRLKTEKEITFPDGYYICLTVTKTVNGFSDQLKNLFFRTFLTNFSYTTGGVVNEYL